MCFDQLIVHASSPTFCNIKPGNMFFVKNESFSHDRFENWKKSFSNYGLQTFSTKLSETTTAILVLNLRWTRKILSEKAVQTYLSEKAHNTVNVFEFVEELFTRMKKNTGFPHEVGVILGYPVEDVIEFEKHGGQGYKYCGCWKSYCDVEKAKKCQCKYKACISMCDRMYEQGYSLKQIIEEYGKCADVA
ncbi:MAG: DUF3793 family protein [Treponema sp.]|nr:DUF3793 family protein [Treponema sp.]